jgi:microsomal epoxide hydrolase
MPAWIWEHQIAHFARHYRVVALDPRSHGDSERVTEGHYPNRLARDIRELTQHLELPPTVLVGWSMGALQVLTAVEEFGTEWLGAVVLVDEVLGYPPNAWIDSRQRGKGRLELQADRQGVTDRFVRGMYRRPQPEDYLQRVMAASLRVPTNTAVTLSAGFAAVGDWRKILPNIDRPFLFVVTEPQRKQAEGVSNDVPSARVEVFEQAGHALFVDEPDRFNRLLEDFLIQAGLGP